MRHLRYISIVSLLLLLLGCFSPPAYAHTDPSECAATPEQSREILSNYGFTVVEHAALGPASAQKFMADNGARDDQRAGVVRLVFWRITALAPGISGVRVGDFVILHTSETGCLLRTIVFMSAAGMRKFEGEPI